MKHKLAHCKKGEMNLPNFWDALFSEQKKMLVVSNGITKGPGPGGGLCLFALRLGIRFLCRTNYPLGIFEFTINTMISDSKSSDFREAPRLREAPPFREALRNSSLERMTDHRDPATSRRKHHPRRVESMFSYKSVHEVQWRRMTSKTTRWSRRPHYRRPGGSVYAGTDALATNGR